jgi:hypothetical protein
MASGDVRMRDDVLRIAVEDEIIGYESQRTSSPFSGVNGTRNGIVFDSFLETRLAILAEAGTRE